jgi:hypothetical protein
MSEASHPRVAVGVLLTDDQSRVLLTLRTARNAIQAYALRCGSAACDSGT